MDNSPKKFEDMNVKTYSTWSKVINEVIGHFRTNELILLHWASKNWKTMLTMSIANDNWSQGIKTAFLSLEMEKTKLKTQQSAIRCWIDRISFERWDYTEQQRAKYTETYENFDKNFTIFDETCFDNLTPETVCKMIEELYRDWKFELFIIDSLQLMIWPWDTNTQQEKIIKMLKTLKNKLPICIVLIHHNNKEWSTFSWSQALENFSDWRLTIKKELDPDANWVTIFHKTIIQVYKERLWKELQFEFDFDRWNLIYNSHWYIK